MKTQNPVSRWIHQGAGTLLDWPLEVLSPLCYVPDSIAGLVADDALSADLLSPPAEAIH